MFLDRTDFAGDFTTPLESTMAVDPRLGRPRFVAAAAAKQLAAFDAR